MSAEPLSSQETTKTLIEAVHALWPNTIGLYLTTRNVKRFVVQSHYGNVEMILSELWFNDETKALHLSFRLPEGYDLVRTDALKIDSL